MPFSYASQTGAGCGLGNQTIRLVSFFLMNFFSFFLSLPDFIDALLTVDLKPELDASTVGDPYSKKSNLSRSLRRFARCRGHKTGIHVYRQSYFYKRTALSHQAKIAFGKNETRMMKSSFASAVFRCLVNKVKSATNTDVSNERSNPSTIKATSLDLTLSFVTKIHLFIRESRAVREFSWLKTARR